MSKTNGLILLKSAVDVTNDDCLLKRCIKSVLFHETIEASDLKGYKWKENISDKRVSNVFQLNNVF